MTFTVGETVVYPHHGAALIEEIKVRNPGAGEFQILRHRTADDHAPNILAWLSEVLLDPVDVAQQLPYYPVIAL